MLGIYARQSIEKDNNNSIEDQIDKGKLYAASLELDYKIYSDRGITAVKNTIDNRKGVQELIKDIENKLISAVFVYDLSRLTRNDRVNADFLDLFKKFNIKVYSIIDGITDAKDANSVFSAKLKALWNEQVVQVNSTKIISVLEMRAQQGKAPGGWLKAMGYKTDSNQMLVIDNDEAEIVKEIYDLCIKGHGSGKISKILNERGVLTKSTRVLLKKYEDFSSIPSNINLKQWAPNTILSILKNPLYKGQRLHVGKTVKSPVIIDEQIWELAQVKISQNRNSHSSSKHQYLLNKLCFCGKCGSNISGRTRLSKRDNYYKCASKLKKQPCGLRSINIDTLDSIVWAMIVENDLIFSRAKSEVENLKNPEFSNELRKEKKKLEKELLFASNKKNNAFTFLNRGLYDEAEAEKIMIEANIQIQDIKQHLKDIEFKLNFNTELFNKIDDVQELVRKWEELVFTDDFNLQFELIRMFVDKIIIDFDDAEDMYTITITVKIPGYDELITFYVDSKGEPISGKSGNGGKKTGLKSFKSSTKDALIKESSINLASKLVPPYLPMQQMLHLLAEAVTRSRAKFRLRIMAFCSWMSCPNLSAAL